MTPMSDINQKLFYNLPHYPMTKKYETVKVMWSDWKEYERTPCEIYLRVMGYLRPLSGFNIWKRSEAMSRTYFTEERVNNSSFIKKYLDTKTCSCNS